MVCVVRVPVGVFVGGWDSPFARIEEGAVGEEEEEGEVVVFSSGVLVQPAEMMPQ